MRLLPLALPSPPTPSREATGPLVSPSLCAPCAVTMKLVLLLTLLLAIDAEAGQGVSKCRRCSRAERKDIAKDLLVEEGMATQEPTAAMKKPEDLSQLKNAIEAAIKAIVKGSLVFKKGEATRKLTPALKQPEDVWRLDDPIKAAIQASVKGSLVKKGEATRKLTAAIKQAKREPQLENAIDRR